MILISILIKFLKTPFLRNSSGRLLLNCFHLIFLTASQRRLRVKDTNVDMGEVSLKLNHITREKKNWLHLAQKLDMSPEIINNIRRADNPTERLIDYYDTTENASVQDFIQNLKSMRRSSTAYILQVALENTNARLCSGEGNWV